MFNKRPVHRPWTLALTVLMCVSTLGIGSLLWHTRATLELAATTEPLATIKFWSRVIRLSLIVLLGAAWPSIIRHLVRANDSRGGALLRARWRVISWLLITEAVLGQSILPPRTP